MAGWRCDVCACVFLLYTHHKPFSNKATTRHAPARLLAPTTQQATKAAHADQDASGGEEEEADAPRAKRAKAGGKK